LLRELPLPRPRIHAMEPAFAELIGRTLLGYGSFHLGLGQRLNARSTPPHTRPDRRHDKHGCQYSGDKNEGAS